MKAFYWISAFFYLIAAVAFSLLIFQISLPIDIDIRLIGQGALGIASLLLLVASIGSLVASRRDR